jgi:hypothetical protein
VAHLMPTSSTDPAPTLNDDAPSIALRSGSVAVTRPPARRRRWPGIVLGFSLASTVIAGVAIASQRGADPVPPILLPQAPVPAPPSPQPVTVEIGPTGITASTPEAGVELSNTGIKLDLQRAIRPPPARAAGRGFLTIDSHPYATIYIDGRRFDDTPIYRAPLAAGRHVLRAVLADGRSRDQVIVIAANSELRPKELTW